MGNLLIYDVKHYIEKYGLRAFIETGTLYGESVEYARKFFFNKIISIEIEEDLATQAASKFSHDKRVSIIIGDSSKKIKDALKEADGPCLFWLDAHFPGGDRNDEKRRGYLDETSVATRVPLLKEIEEIAKYKYFEQSVLLIDDARLFESENQNLDNHLKSIGQNEVTRDVLCPYISESIFDKLKQTHDIQRIDAYGEGNYIVTPILEKNEI